MLTRSNYELEFSNAIIEEANRQVVLSQTKNLRDIMFARAMASTVIYEKSSSEIDTNINDKSAMKDWFENE